MKTTLTDTITIPDKIEVRLEGRTVVAKGPKGEVKRTISTSLLSVSVKDNKIVVSCARATKREKTSFGTLAAHLRNMIKGISEGYTYALKICSGHFPMNVAVSGRTVTIKNFLGEKVPRVTTLPEGVSVKVAGDHITIESHDRELAGNAAAQIERLTFIPYRDRRIYQDGIYITAKAGKETTA